jgi:hypothetical protein
MAKQAFQHLPDFIYHQSASPTLAEPTPLSTQTNLICMPFPTTTLAYYPPPLQQNQTQPPKRQTSAQGQI